MYIYTYTYIDAASASEDLAYVDTLVFRGGSPRASYVCTCVCVCISIYVHVYVFTF